MLHLPKLFPDLPPLGRILTPLLKLFLGELPVTKVRRGDPRLTRFGLCASAAPTM